MTATDLTMNDAAVDDAPPPLVRPLSDGPVDVIADVHGELGLLTDLLRHLGYDGAGVHPAGRRLVFLGDLVDRGPDSPGVVALVARLVAAGRAQCVVGNHELNLLLRKRKADNLWFYGEPVPDGVATLDTDADREAMLAFFATLPMALRRPDLRAVHACWDEGAIDAAAAASAAVDLFGEERRRIDDELARELATNEVDRNLAHQNRNAVKVLTSGPEHRAAAPFEAGGKLRLEARRPWWNDYRGPVFCVFGHYWRTPVKGLRHGDDPFDGTPLHAPLGAGRAMCIDYSAGGRATQRRERVTPFTTTLCALRWPEATLMFDDGRALDLPIERPRS